MLEQGGLNQSKFRLSPLVYSDLSATLHLISGMNDALARRESLSSVLNVWRARMPVDRLAAKLEEFNISPDEIEFALEK